MSFSFKIAPGVRIRTGKSGMRASIGPRAARVHVGGYRTGISTGAGPFTLYRNIGRAPTRRRSSGGHQSTRNRAAASVTRTSLVAAQRRLAQASKASDAQATVVALQHVCNLHRGRFLESAPPTAPPPAPVDEVEIRARHLRSAVEGISRLHHKQREEVTEAATVAADAEIAAARTAAATDRARVQAELDRHWQGLRDNDHDTVLATLAEAYADNETPAAAVGVTGDHVMLVVGVPGPDVLPERMPSRTAAGNVSLKRMTKTQRNGFYDNLVFGHLLATIRETFAVAPGINVVRSAVVRARPSDAYGHTHHECLLAATFTRAALQGVAWDTTDPATITAQISTEQLLKVTGQAKNIVPVEISGEPDLTAMLAAIDHE